MHESSVIEFTSRPHFHVLMSRCFKEELMSSSQSGTKKESDPDITAVTEVYEALKDLSAEARVKVIRSVSILLGIAFSETPSGNGQIESKVQQTDAESKRSDAPQKHSPASGKPTSLIELIQDKKPTTKRQLITLFAYYREKILGKPYFSRTDLKEYFSQAKERPSQNYDRDFTAVVKKGWIHEDSDQSYLTSRGVEAVETNFPGSHHFRQQDGKKKGQKSGRTAPRAKRRS
jgi:glucan-binding YG repeat protein